MTRDKHGDTGNDNAKHNLDKYYGEVMVCVLRN